jgi:hypothetical protein
MAGEYKPGDTVPLSGIYGVSHDPRHAEPHEVTCIERRKFPPCRTCKEPRFVLVRAAKHIEDHRHFWRK